MSFIKNVALSALCLLLAVPFVRGQEEKPMTKRQLDSLYQINIGKTWINGVYIPKDMDEAFNELDRLSTAEGKAKFISGEEEYVAKKLHFGLGRWMATNWNFEKGSRMSHYLKSLGIGYQDDMVNFMLISYHRHLSHKPLDLEARAKTYEAKREKERQAALEKGKTISSKKIN